MKLPTWHASGNREQAWRNSMNGIGRKLMASMGWKEGETLGRNENGLVKCLQPDAEDQGPEKRTKGIGAKTSIHSSNWWEAAFNDAASSIGKVGSKGKKRKANGDEKEERGTKKKKKEKKEKKRKQATNRDGTDTSATVDELRIVENLSKQKWGFTGGREGKMERIRRQEQEFLSKVQSEKKSEGGAEGKTSTSSEVSAKKKRKAKTKSDEKELHRIEACEAKRVEYSAAPWWGSKIFSFSGVLGRLERKAGAQNEGLTEKDQVKAFFKAKENAADGKGGIGSKFIDIKLGEDFEGQKITFGGPEAAKEGDAGQIEGDGLNEKKKKKKKDKKKDKKAKSKKSKKSKK